MGNAQFVKSKDPVLVEYQRGRKKVGDAVAGRGFSFEPGFMYDIQNELEIDAKLKISEINYAILQAEIERDIKQAGLDYDLAFKNARIAWESDKQALLYAWDQELIGIKQARAHEDHLLDLMAVEVSKRANLLLEAKTAIELEAEALRLQIAELDGSTGEYEIQLANAKLLTANKKLEVIPILQQILAIESDIVGAGREMVGKDWIIKDQSESVSVLYSQVADLEGQIYEIEKEVVSAELSMIKAEEDLVDDIGGSGGKIEEEKTYLTDAKKTAADISALISPLLTDLVSEMDKYVIEIPDQTTIKNDIAAKKGETAIVKANTALEYTQFGGIIDQKKAIAKEMDAIVAISEKLEEYKDKVYGPALSELIQAYTDYAADILTGNGFKLLIARKQADIKRIEIQRVEREALVAAAEVAKEAQISALSTAKLSNRTLEASNRVAISDQKVTDTTARITAEDQARADIVLAEDTSFGVMKAKKEVYQTTKIDAELADATSLETARQEEDVTRTNNYIDKEEAITDIKINTDVTARLMHLLSQD